MSGISAAAVVAFVSVGVSVCALAVSYFTLRKARRVDRRELFLRVHERLVSADLQRGRRHLLTGYDCPDGPYDHFQRLNPTEQDEANRAIAEFDIAGLYCSKKYIKTKELLEQWAPALVRLWPASEPLRVQRTIYSPGVPTWPYFHALAIEAEKHLREMHVPVEGLIQPRCDREGGAERRPSRSRLRRSWPRTRRRGSA